MGLLPERFSKISAGNVQFNHNNETVALFENPALHRSLLGKEIAMIFQEPMSSLNPVHRCGDQVAEMIRLHEGTKDETEIRKRVLALFEEVKLPRVEQLYDSYPHQLSGGQRQRVMIAMAISCNPSLLIADEPTTALDVTVQASILQLLRELQQTRSMGVILITHDLGVVAEVADRVLVMQHGKVVEEGSINEIFQHPKEAYTRGLLSCKPTTQIRYAELLTVRDFVDGKVIASQKTVDPVERASRLKQL
jgi:peptide/nickel transport system ATP-binding protein